MNEEAASLGMTETKYVDPSGISPGNLSTAKDQLKLAEAAMADGLFASIVRKYQAQLPTAGTVYNVNSELGKDGIVGVKTGWTEEAGACFIFAADHQVGDRSVRILGVVLGQDTLADAFGATKALIHSVGPTLEVVNVAPKDTIAAAVDSRWGVGTIAVPARDLSVVLWPGYAIETRIEKAPSLDKVEAGTEVGKIIVNGQGQSQEVALIAQDAIPDPSVVWRLQRLR
jgi:D-alanyl-D-alanine carboxypeptidase (penicillin-binding protein 5/6)